MWQVLLSPDVQDFLKKQDKQVEERIRKGLRKLECENPFHFIEHFENKNYYKYRIGEYRALIDIDFENKIILTRVIDHRSVIYRK